MKRILNKEERHQLRFLEATMSAQFQSESTKQNKRPLLRESDDSGLQIYINKVIACIPGETVAAYILIQKAFEQFPKIFSSVSWWLILLMLLFNFFYLRRVDPKKNIIQHVVVDLAFIVWAYSLGEPFKQFLGDSYQPIYASVGLVIVSLMLPLTINTEKLK